MLKAYNKFPNLFIMIRKLSFLVPIIILTLMSSCSKDEVFEEKKLLGVWERVVNNEYATSTYSLIFADDYIGVDTSISEFTDGTSTGNATSFSWSMSEGIVSILKDGMPEPTYVIENDQLLLIDNPEISFSKVSDDYSGYN